MEAAFIAIGTELLGHSYLDTNSLKIAGVLEKYGVRLCRKYVLPDDEAILIEEIPSALSKHDVVVMSGGLGPTEDDLTKDVMSKILGIELVEDPAVLEHIESLFRDRGMEMPDVNRKQALIFPKQRTLGNARGTAPAFHLNVKWHGKPKHIWIFPGVPHELEGFLETELEPWLMHASAQSLHRRVVRIIGLTESAVEEKLQPFYRNHRSDVITIMASRGEIQIHLQARGDADDAYPKLNAMEQELRAIYGTRVFGLDTESIEAVVGRLLASRGETVATAESCTGGLLASRITDVSGSSAYFLGGAVAYSAGAKLFLVGVDPKLVQDHGEVSEEVAREMAQGVRRRFDTTYGMGITGIAGPTGGTAKKPVGTVHIAVASRTDVRHKKYLFVGTRELVKHYSTQMALNALRLMILEVEE
ncbi:MAG TPA: competence/damage-inducible protein A [Thermoanaerobaculia bacterium]|nr:competence/damage-inducible protein A [Thermoanaerobaculia bacterium]